MESVPFEKFGISQCKFDECDQKFNTNSVALAVWLYGVILLKQLKSPILTEERELEAKEDILGITLTEQETLKMREETKGFIGITCPKCRKTSLYETNYNGLTDFEMMLQSSLKNRSHFHEKPYEFSTTKPIPIALKYYSPVQMPSDLRERFSEESFYYSEYAYEGVLPFSDELGVSFVDDTLNPPENSFASYSEWSVPEPAGSSVCLEWFDEKKLSEIIEHENEKSVRILPRYHYYQDLMDKCDNLLRYKLYTGSNFDQELKKIENLLEEDLLDEEAKRPFRFHHVAVKRSKRHQQYLDFDPKKFGKFLNILISEPIEFNPFVKDNKWINNYLWADKDPFKGQGLPMDFAFEDQDDKNDVKSDELKKSHNKMVSLVQGNFHKQYVQEFLRENLVDFLEEYEELIQRNKFSYAHVWKLKESYLEGLYRAANRGLRDDKPFSMHAEGEVWKIRFNNNTKSYKNDLGFLWIYMALQYKGKPVYYSSLHDTYSTKPGAIQNDNEIIVYMKNKEELSVNTGGNLTKQYYSDKKAVLNYKKRTETILTALENARAHGESEQAYELERELKKLTNEIKIAGIDCKIENYKIVRFKAKKFKDSNYEDINDKIKKNFRDALKKIKKEQPVLFEHFNTHIKRKGGAFIYEPPEEIAWHLD